MSFYIMIDADCGCKDCRDWMEEVGCDHIAIIDARPRRGWDALNTITNFVMGDVSKLTREQIDRICIGRAKAFDLTPEEVREDLLGDFGFPIKVGNRVICTDLAQGRRILQIRRIELGKRVSSL